METTKKKWVELNNEGYAYDWSDFGLPGCDRASYNQNMCRHCHLQDIYTTTETQNVNLYLLFKILITLKIPVLLILFMQQYYNYTKTII